MYPPKTKILVVDDMKTMRMVMKKALKDIGFLEVQEADDGATAWPMIDEAVNAGTPFGLILSDWNMPKLKGIDLLRKVRSDARTKETPFLLVTAESDKAQVVEAIQAGVDNYVTKPFTAQTVREKLAAVHEKKSKAA